MSKAASKMEMSRSGLPGSPLRMEGGSEEAVGNGERDSKELGNRGRDPIMSRRLSRLVLLRLVKS